MTDYKPYPEPAEIRSGIKVSWNYYKTEAEAKECAEAAKHNARIALSQGYDFGYQSPGWIVKPGDKQNFYPDLYEVCLP